MASTSEEPAEAGTAEPHRRRSTRGGSALRTTLVQTALVELERVGRPEAVTIAAIVTAAGCTPPSLYHYWPTREQLLIEAAALGWSRFEHSQADAVASDPDPRERIRRRGAAYLAFSRDHQPLFRVLFLGPPAPAPAEVEGSHSRGPGFWALRDDIRAAIAAGQIATDRIVTGQLDEANLAMALWCAVHGLATLALADPTGQLNSGDFLTVLDHAILGPDPQDEDRSPGPAHGSRGAGH